MEWRPGPKEDERFLGLPVLEEFWNIWKLIFSCVALRLLENGTRRARDVADVIGNKAVTLGPLPLLQLGLAFRVHYRRVGPCKKCSYLVLFPFIYCRECICLRNKGQADPHNGPGVGSITPTRIIGIDLSRLWGTGSLAICRSGDTFHYDATD